MNRPRVYEIRIDGLIPDTWSGWLEGLAIEPAFDGETMLKGELPDQAALLGVLSKIHSLNLKIIAVTRMPALVALDTNK